MDWTMDPPRLLRRLCGSCSFSMLLYREKAPLLRLLNGTPPICSGHYGNNRPMKQDTRHQHAHFIYDYSILERHSLLSWDMAVIFGWEGKLLSFLSTTKWSLCA